MTRFDASPIMSGLTQFQRNTVEHVMNRFHGTDAVDRFLVADQTGLGKTMVARGVIARTIEQLQDDPQIDRIDVVYVCSNQDLARQNLRKLNVTGGRQHGIASRLTLLSRHARHFAPVVVDGPKAVNLVSFTPGTSFSRGWASGTAHERAMILLMLRQADELDLADPQNYQAALRLLRGSVRSTQNFARYVDELHADMPEGPAASIRNSYLKALRGIKAGAPRSAMDDVRTAIADLRQDRSVDASWELIGELRATLARCSVAVLTPDLVILDEFQRFRDLLKPGTEAGELAHHLFRSEEDASWNPKVLLLSATPFKAFTYAEEAAGGDSHHRDFMEVLNFLTAENGDGRSARVDASLRKYREAVVTGRIEGNTGTDVREALLEVMVRTERPELLDVRMRREVHLPIHSPSADDFVGFVALSKLASAVSAPMSVEYWKAAPYFVNFMDAYKIGRQVRAALEDPARVSKVKDLLSYTQRIDARSVDRFDPVPPGNARLQEVARQTVDCGWWKLLWVPPSLHYLEPAGVFAEEGLRSMSKLLIFSSWTATPTAAASLLSYEADRLTWGSVASERVGTQERTQERRVRAGRLAYRVDPQTGRADSMSTLALFWPMPGLARIGDVRARCRVGGRPLPAGALRETIVAELQPHHTSTDAEPARATAWFEALRHPGGIPNLTRDEIIASYASSVLPEEDVEDREADDAYRHVPARGFEGHIDLALAVAGSEQTRRIDDQLLGHVADIACHSPANVAYRALRSCLSPQADVTDTDVWRAAAQLSSALRSLFTRPETSLLLDQLYPDGFYWQKVLRYCADGNLQAVLDEYIHHLAAANGGAPRLPAQLDLLARLASNAMTARPAQYQWFDPDAPGERRAFTARFAVRYGGRDEGVENAQRQGQVRESFNSPFWPFVLVSTSVGQEGIDFHWWCHSLLHWNTPANPVDFEQREGRIDRYDGLAVRRNLAAAHGAEMLAAEDDDPWRAGYRIAADAHPELGSFSPHWVYPGQTSIERLVAPFPLSVEQARLEQVKRDVARYRLTFGQPRQEDLLQILHERADKGELDLAELRIDLSAPPTGAQDPPLTGS